MQHRHVDQGDHLRQFEFADQYIHCPVCQHPGVLKYLLGEICRCGQLHPYYLFSCVKCFNHFNSNTPNPLPQTGNYVARHASACQHCGGNWLKVSKRVQSPAHAPFNLYATCSRCQKPSTFTITQQQIHFEKHRGINRQQHGFELFLSTNTPAGEVVVYHPQHLYALKQFIQADLRERSQTAGNRSYFSRLPAWIKSARHRKTVLKAIARLENMAASVHINVESK